MPMAERALPAAPPGNTTQAINQRLFETSLDLILVVDRMGDIMRVSPSVETILGYWPDELMGRSAAAFLHRDDLDNTRNEMRQARRGRIARNFDCRYVHKNGSVVTLAWKGVWSEAEQQYFFIGRDMTERIGLEQQLHQAQKMESIGRLTGGIAHDFNNILTIIIGMNDIVAGAVANQPKLADLTRTIDEAAGRGAKLVQHMLSFARKRPLESRVLNLNDVVATTLDILRPTLGEDIALEAALAEGACRTMADPSRLQDALINLAVNARDAMPKGGRLLIETAHVHLDEDYAASHAEVAAGAYAALFISDTGTGMPREVIERAFEPFFTTKDVGRGTGLGLSMVYGFVKQSRGHVKIYSEVGHGTTIKIYLPTATADAAEQTAHLADETVAGGSETILVVEDDPAVRKLATGTLESAGYQIIEAADGKAALRVLDGDSPIDLLFTDMIMPNGIAGQELLALARRRRPCLKALFTSGYSEHLLKGGENGPQEVPFLEKPYRRTRLLSMVRTMLDAKPDQCIG
jgi:PAS domain S-box-containing protein